MNYCIKYAVKGKHLLSIDKSGNRYYVADYDKETHRTTMREEFETYDNAEWFYELFRKNNEYGETIEIDRSAYDFDAFTR